MRCDYISVYDVGLTAFDITGWEKRGEDSDRFSNSDTNSGMRQKLIDHMQFTGYIRCVNCNGAGAWEFISPHFTLGLMGQLLGANEDVDTGSMVGQLQLYDETSPQWQSDGEEQFLERLKLDPEDSYLWSKLGNLYKTGGRPELAAAVFEHSVEIDASQVESHYSLAALLMQIGELELAAKHFRQALVHARVYTKLDALNLRELLAHGLCDLLDIHQATKEQGPFLPTQEEVAV
ncbi:hypothetical protein [Paenibacillus sp. GCM10027626]|uniref:hypothetical protein n=1 Tax=Paenibacillus sp. GCM10027626 TaxID=3273411 RepID=UPI00363E7C6D